MERRWQRDNICNQGSRQVWAKSYSNLLQTQQIQFLCEGKQCKWGRYFENLWMKAVDFFVLCNIYWPCLSRSYFFTSNWISIPFARSNLVIPFELTTRRKKRLPITGAFDTSFFNRGGPIYLFILNARMEKAARSRQRATMKPNHQRPRLLQL